MKNINFYKYTSVMLTVLLVGACSGDKEPKQVFPNVKMTKMIKEQNETQLQAADIRWITVSCNFRNDQADKKVEIWYETPYGTRQILKDTICSNPQNLIMIGWQSGYKGTPGYYEVETAQDYEYEIVNDVITSVLADNKEKGSKL